MNINNYPLEAAQINDEDFYDVDYWTGVAYESRKISGANLKALLGQDATTAKREIVEFINKTGSALSEGTIVYLKTSSSSSEYPEVELADASTEITSSKTIGAVYATVANDDIGIIVTSGEVDNLDTSMYSIGDRLWLSTTAGEVTTTAPVSPDHAVFIGIVTRAQNGNGRILYRIQNGYELGELHDVLLDTPPTDGDVLTYDSATGLWKNEAGGGGGLTYFTEAENTSAPNGTVYVDSLTAAASSTNADFAIRPKGTGAIVAAIPDNTATGGNKRGANATDLQTARTAATQVASGAYSFAAGRWNTVSGDSSAALGVQNIVAGGLGAFATGYISTASGNSSTAHGNSTASGGVSFSTGTSTASGGNSAAFGSSVASGNNSFAAGTSAIANSTNSVALGYYSTTNGVNGRMAFAQTNSGIYGDTQKSLFILGIRTTNNTATTLVTGYLGGAASTNNQVILSNNAAFRFKGTIIGKQSGSTNVAAWDVDGLIVRGANAASTTLIVSNVNVVDNTPTFGTPTLAADTTNGGLRVQVTGVAATNIQWTATIETTEVIYA